MSGIYGISEFEKYLFARAATKLNVKLYDRMPNGSFKYTGNLEDLKFKD